MNEERYAIYNNAGAIPSAQTKQKTKNIKIIFQNLLYNCFSVQNTEFINRDQEFRKYTIKDEDIFVVKDRERSPIHIVREFPNTNRNYPLLLIDIEDGMKEKKVYLGWDNIAWVNIWEQDGIKVGEIVQGQVYEARIRINVAAQSVDERDFLCDSIQDIFQNYYRSNYIWEHPDIMTYFQVNIGHGPISSTLSNSPFTDTSGSEQFPIYTGTVSVDTTIEQQYRKMSKNYIMTSKIKATNVEPTDPPPFVVQLPQP